MPPSSQAETRLTSTLANLLEVGLNLPQNVECHTHFQCPETVGKRVCKGTVAVSRKCESEIEWRCRQCMTRGILKNSRFERRYVASEEKSIALTFPKKEFSALNELRGLPPDAHDAIMCSSYLSDGGMVVAEAKAYLDLLSTFPKISKKVPARNRWNDHLCRHSTEFWKQFATLIWTKTTFSKILVARHLL